MHCERMVKVLVRVYNAIIKYNHFPFKWLDVLDVMIEKVKGNRINKLRDMKIIEAYLQLLMRIFLGLRISDNYKNDMIMSEHNYLSRKRFSINSALLEKRLIFDLARKTDDLFAHTTSDLET